LFHNLIACRADNSDGCEEFHARNRPHADGTGVFPDGSRCEWLDDRPEKHQMGRYLLLWLLGVPLPILFLIWIIGGVH
jgi:hypothetical protein